MQFLWLMTFSQLQTSWAKIQLSSVFLKFPSLFKNIFPQTFIIFVLTSSFWPSKWVSHSSRKALATPLSIQTVWRFEFTRKLWPKTKMPCKRCHHINLWHHLVIINLIKRNIPKPFQLPTPIKFLRKLDNIYHVLSLGCNPIWCAFDIQYL